MWALSTIMASLWHSFFGNSPGGGMRGIGIIILAIGLMMGGYALTMNVGVDVPAQDYGDGISTPAMQVANIDRMSQRQNYMIFSGILSMVGAILFGFGSMGRRDSPAAKEPIAPAVAENLVSPHGTTSVSICPSCRHMGAGDATHCARCNEPLSA